MIESARTCSGFSFWSKMKRMKKMNAWVYLAAGILLMSLAAHVAEASDSVAVHFLYSIGREGDAPGQFRSPMAISVDPKGALYVADTGNNRIQKLSPTGEVLGMVGGFGWGDNQFQRPEDLCAENGLDLFVADYENRRIIRCDRALHWIDAYYYPATGDEKRSLGFPAGVALSIHSDLFITDAENMRILKVNALREAVHSFGDFAEGEGELVEPQQITIDFSDRIYVSDRKRGCIVMYDYFGNYLQTVGKGFLKEPEGLCIGRQGALFVADGGRNQVIIFSGDGRIIGTVGYADNNGSVLSNPSDVAVHVDRMYVTEAGRHRIQVFALHWFKIP